MWLLTKETGVAAEEVRMRHTLAIVNKSVKPSFRFLFRQKKLSETKD